MNISCKRLICLCGLLCFGSLSAWAATNPPPGNGMDDQKQIAGIYTSALPLPLLVAQSMDRGAVMLYGSALSGMNNVRRCVDLNNGDVGNSLFAYDCDFAKANQKWLLDSSHQIRAQVDPSKCLYWPDKDSSIGLRDCEELPGKNQIFLFTLEGWITDISGRVCAGIGTGSTDNGTPLVANDCADHPYQRFTLQPDPKKLVQIRISEVDGTSYHEGGSYLASGMLFSGPTEKNLKEHWFLTPANDGTNAVFVQNATNGACLSSTGWGGENDILPCKTPGSDAIQKWNFQDGMLVNASNAYCLMAALPLTFQAFVDKYWYTGKCIDELGWSGTRREQYKPLRVSIEDAKQPLNVALMAQNGIVYLSLLAPAQDRSQTEVEKLDVIMSFGSVSDERLRKANLLRAAVDLMPDRSIRFRTTGRCLDLHEGSGTAAQWDCNGGYNQKWTAVDVADLSAYFRIYDRGDYPIFTDIGLRSDAKIHGEYQVLSNNLVGNGYEMAYAGPAFGSPGHRELRWYIDPISDVLESPCGLPDLYRNLNRPINKPFGECVRSPRYTSENWHGKFKYGAYSTLISTFMLRAYYPSLVAELNEDFTGNVDYSPVMQHLKDHYDSLVNVDSLAWSSQRRGGLFEPQRSVINTRDVNAEFMKKMASHPELEPVDHLIKDNKFTSTNMQYNAHRGIYNSGLGIPPNSLASMVAAYLAGIRSVEFDVLQTKDDQNVVIHDLTTNRLNARYDLPAVEVEKHNYVDIAHTNVDILNPLGSTPSAERTGIQMLMKTENVLGFIDKYMPEMTVYIDARNSSPASVLEILRRHPEYVDNCVIKIYPFTLKGGAKDLVTEYARLRKLPYTQAASEMAKIRPNVLLALGSVGEQGQEGAEMSEVGVDYKDFTEDMFNAQLPVLPFSRTSKVSANSNSGSRIFSDEELVDIERKTYRIFRWAMSFAGVTKPLVFQVGLLPSVKLMSKNQNLDSTMPVSDRKVSATTDNFIALYREVMASRLPIRVDDLSTDQSAYLNSLLENTVFGFSDRYPDYSLAKRKADGTVDPTTVRDFLYKMDGTVYEKNDYGAKQMRSSKAVQRMITELKAQGVPVQYVTTDLPEDLRTAAMGILGASAGFGLPEDVSYRPGAIIKAESTPADIQGFVPPKWSTQLGPSP